MLNILLFFQSNSPLINFLKLLSSKIFTSVVVNRFVNFVCLLRRLNLRLNIQAKFFFNLIKFQSKFLI